MPEDSAADGPVVSPPPSLKLLFYVALQKRNLEALERHATRYRELTAAAADASTIQAEAWAMRDAAMELNSAWSQTAIRWDVGAIDDSRKCRSFVAAVREIVRRTTEAGCEPPFESALYMSSSLMMIEYRGALDLVPDPAAPSWGVDFDAPEAPAEPVAASQAPAEPERRAEPEAETPSPPEASKGIDHEASASALRKAGKPTQARLVEYMTTRSEATVEDVANEVHDRPNAGDKTIRANVRRTNDALAELGSRLRFRVASGRVFRETVREVAEK